MPFKLHEHTLARLHPLEEALDPARGAAPPEVQLRLYGGVPSERLDLTLTLRADDTMGIDLEDRLGGRYASKTAAAPRARLDVLRSAILESGVLRLEAGGARIPPDSVVGELRIRGGPSVGVWSFLGDVGQAEAVREAPPLELVCAVGPMMSLGKELLQIDTLNPYLIADAPGPIYIAKVDQDPPGRDVEREHVVLYNLRAESLPVAGFELRDLAGHRYAIPPGTTIPAHGMLRVWTGEGADTPTDLYQRRRRAIWNNAGDRVVVRDAKGAEVASRSYLPRR